METPTGYRLSKNDDKHAPYNEKICVEVRKFRTTSNRSFSSRRRPDDDGILGSRLRSDVHVTSGRRPPVVVVVA